MGVDIGAGLGDPETLARDFVARVIPGILEGEHSESVGSEAVQRLELLGATRAAFFSEAPDEHAEALISAAKQFAPPPSLKGGSEVLSVLTGTIALRAAMPDLLSVPASERYNRAANWVCQNLGSLIWWNCD